MLEMLAWRNQLAANRKFLDDSCHPHSRLLLATCCSRSRACRGPRADRTGRPRTAGHGRARVQPPSTTMITASAPTRAPARPRPAPMRALFKRAVPVPGARAATDASNRTLYMAGPYGRSVAAGSTSSRFFCADNNALIQLNGVADAAGVRSLGARCADGKDSPVYNNQAAQAATTPGTTFKLSLPTVEQGLFGTLMVRADAANITALAVGNTTAGDANGGRIVLDPQDTSFNYAVKQSNCSLTGFALVAGQPYIQGLALYLVCAVTVTNLLPPSENPFVAAAPTDTPNTNTGAAPAPRDTSTAASSGGASPAWVGGIVAISLTTVVAIAALAGVVLNRRRELRRKHKALVARATGATTSVVYINGNPAVTSVGVAAAALGQQMDGGTVPRPQSAYVPNNAPPVPLPPPSSMPMPMARQSIIDARRSSAGTARPPPLSLVGSHVPDIPLPLVSPRSPTVIRSPTRSTHASTHPSNRASTHPSTVVGPTSPRTAQFFEPGTVLSLTRDGSLSRSPAQPPQSQSQQRQANRMSLTPPGSTTDRRESETTSSTIELNPSRAPPPTSSSSAGGWLARIPESGEPSLAPTVTPIRVRGPRLAATSFVPAQPDELALEQGDVLHVHAVYSDGWAYCSNLAMDPPAKGLVPVTCIDAQVADVELLQMQQAMVVKGVISAVQMGSLQRAPGSSGRGSGAGAGAY
ncbi:hypothetical protein AMAG_01774 [Allomyces macrogynus ATCC 38327]|uniref:SH3 domain-containing protein n=1 Tax=Allomyces macrogynus (strain ATCC 38327) TaxID=578462 RepID=A0A0L0RZS2_ALLM3|nr:hypothetical protein AMAG_01774 [Allomyces macrogynus ATCC 38327]|eukprot:KNE55917.1 hypothetical protein AMAG_01774 [Allomyces macrogynus ATCC 38327]